MMKAVFRKVNLRVVCVGKEVKNAKKQRKTIEGERLEISARKLDITREYSCKDGHNKGQK